MRKAKTHFEQIPVEVVKKIIREEEEEEEEVPEKEESSNVDVIVERPRPKTEPYSMRTNCFTERGLKVEGQFEIEPEVLTYPEWQKPYLEAMVEIDHSKLQERILAAEAAIFDRLQATSPSPVRDAERQAIEDAQASLLVLKKEQQARSRTAREHRPSL